MKKKKKRNYYNLIVYFFTFSLIMGVIIMIPIGYADFNPIPKFWEYFLAIIFFLNLGLLMLSWYLMGKFESKITVELDKPKKPITYQLKSFDFNLLNPHISTTLKNMNYQFIEEDGIDSIIFYKKTHKFYCHPSNQMDIFTLYDFDRITPDTLKYLVHQRQKISKKFKQNNNYIQIVFFLRVKHFDEYLENYLMKRTNQYLTNYTLIAVVAEDTKELYIPRPDWAQANHYSMKKIVMKILKRYINQ